MSPTNAALFAFTESSTNVQTCDDEMCSRYVAKYAAGVEGRAFTKILASAGENEKKVQTEPIVNEKIAGVQTSVTKKRQDDDKRKSVTGRIVSITECLCVCKMKQVRKFCHSCQLFPEHLPSESKFGI